MNAKSLFIAIVVALLVIAVPAVAQLPFSDGFESGDLCGWTGCVTLTPVGTDAEQVGNGHAHYEIEFDLLARGRDVCIEKEVGRGATPSSSKGFWFRLKDGNQATYTGGATGWTVTALNPPPGPPIPNHFKFLVGETRRVTFEIDLDNTVNGVAGFYATQLTGLSFDADCSDSDGDHVFPLNLSTDHVYVGTLPD